MGPPVAARGREIWVGAGREERARVCGTHGDSCRVGVSETALIAGDEASVVA
jgi:hypothetical protein